MIEEKTIIEEDLNEDSGIEDSGIEEDLNEDFSKPNPQQNTVCHFVGV